MKHFAIIVSEFNSDITSKLLEGALTELTAANVTQEQIAIYKIPGAIEIPLTAQLLARSQAFHAIICLGAVIRGETDHYDYVCQQVSYGCQRVALDHQVPIIFGVLTTQTGEQAFDRVGGRKGHKGQEAAKAALHMAQLVTDIRDQD